MRCVTSTRVDGEVTIVSAVEMVTKHGHWIVDVADYRPEHDMAVRSILFEIDDDCSVAAEWRNEVDRRIGQRPDIHRHVRYTQCAPISSG